MDALQPLLPQALQPQQLLPEGRLSVLQLTFFFSPVILAIIVLFISFSYSNYKGFIYLKLYVL